MSSVTHPAKDAIIIPFDTYTVHYYSQSSNPWEAAYINCFSTNGHEQVQVGYIVFTHPDKTVLPGQENVPTVPTAIPDTQFNHLEPQRQRDFFVIYYALERFGDVMTILKNAVPDTSSIAASCDPYCHVWALVNILPINVGID